MMCLETKPLASAIYKRDKLGPEEQPIFKCLSVSFTAEYFARACSA
jgi:hypothetical protein